jgi:hypothetical protein
MFFGSDSQTVMPLYRTLCKSTFYHHLIDVIVWRRCHLCFQTGLSWPWLYGSWIYNYLYNQCLSPLMLWVWISIRARCTPLCDKVCQWLATGLIDFVLGLYNNISAILWQSVLLVEETRVLGENHWPVASHWQILSRTIMQKFASFSFKM